MYLIFDIGGTNMRMASSLDGVAIENYSICDTPQKYEDVMEIIRNFSLKANFTNQSGKACFGLPGVFNQNNDSLYYAPNLKGWVGKSIRHDFGRLLECEVALYNDALLAGLGEVVNGSGRYGKVVAYITVGTGIGGVRIVNGRVDTSNYGFEPGHHIINFDFAAKRKFFDWEGFVGGAGIEKKYLVSPEEIHDPKVWNQLNQYLAIGLINTIVYWSPDLIVLGGSVAQNKNVSLKYLKEIISKNLTAFPEIPEIRKGILGPKAALYGGLEIIKS